MLILGVFLAGCTGGKKLIAEKDMEITERDQEIAQLQQEIDQLENAANGERDRADELNAELAQALGDLQEKEKLFLDLKNGASEVTMPNTATFASGSNELSSEGKEIIDTIWSVLDKYPDREILIEGHTDNVPIAGTLQQRFQTNWELSTARALAVLHYVCESHEMDPERLAAMGFGEYRPIVNNDTEEGRATNRRVIIVIRSKA